MLHAWIVRGTWCGLGCAALLACGDDTGPGSSGTSSGGSSGEGGAATSTSTSTSTSTATGTASTTGAGGSGNGEGCTPEPNMCTGDNLSCSCKGSCTLCNDTECFNWGLEVACQSGIAGFTCTCIVDGQNAGSCNETDLVCDLEASCCQQYLVP